MTQLVGKADMHLTGRRAVADLGGGVAAYEVRLLLKSAHHRPLEAPRTWMPARRDKWLPLREASTRSGLSVGRLRYLIKKGDVAARRGPRNAWQVRWRDVLEILDALDT
jgi:hypothetical protein